jgi:hypothetical protein
MVKRPWINSMGQTIICSGDKMCVFCEHCTDIWMGWWGGAPYAISCEYDDVKDDINVKNHNVEGTCPYFKEDYYEKD